MPTYAPVPATFTSLTRKGKVVHLYRHILKEGSRFFDERASNWIKTAAQTKFKKHSRIKDDNRTEKYLADARRSLRTLERGNQMDLKAIQKILRMAYGIQGSERRKLLQPFVDSARTSTASLSRLSAAVAVSGSSIMPATPPSSRASGTTSSSRATTEPETPIDPSLQPSTPEPLFFQRKRTIPPMYSPPVATLIRASTGKSIEPELPQPLFKPLHGRREANLRWRFFAKQMGKVKPPLPSELRLEIELKANIGLEAFTKVLRDNGIMDDGGSGASGSVKAEQDWRAWEQNILTTINTWSHTGERQQSACKEGGPFHPSIGGKPARGNILTPRLYRRLWQQLLSEVPILDTQIMGTQGGKEHKSPKTVFSISKSPHVYHAPTRLGLQALVSDFDRLGFVEPPAKPLPKKTKQPKLK
ncbi:hypothetical protein BGZ74_006099 [Mortierella antarctica]|nr:hypothetical protein BGZ74_006099 [Mortierella antarctica]